MNVLFKFQDLIQEATLHLVSTFPLPPLAYDSFSVVLAWLPQQNIMEGVAYEQKKVISSQLWRLEV